MANIVEIFSSIQGEGLYVGARQIFVRFATCNLTCAYCDTPESRQNCSVARVERTAGQRDFADITNPIDISVLAQSINSLLNTRHHSISFTGGEPLCQAAVIAELAPKLMAPIYLETNGTMPAMLNQVLPFINIISMDIKLPSTTGSSHWQEHYDFLRMAIDKEVFVKVVVSGETQKEEFKQAVDLIGKVNTKIPLIIQPVTPVNGCRAVAPELVLTFQEQALEMIEDVRVIPQTHKFMGQL